MIAMALLPLLIWSFNGIFFGFFLLIYAFGVYNYLHLLYSISPFIMEISHVMVYTVSSVYCT